jgi:hypothetical protein
MVRKRKYVRNSPNFSVPKPTYNGRNISEWRRKTETSRAANGSKSHKKKSLKMEYCGL